MNNWTFVLRRIFWGMLLMTAVLGMLYYLQIPPVGVLAFLAFIIGYHIEDTHQRTGAITYAFKDYVRRDGLTGGRG